jgi:hypothetical protein
MDLNLPNISDHISEFKKSLILTVLSNEVNLKIGVLNFKCQKF